MDTKKEETTPVEEVVETPAAESTPAAEPAPVEEKPKHRYADRLSKIYPDRQFASDEEMDNAVDERFEENETYRQRGEVANQKLIALFEAEPQVGAIVRDMMNGASFREALARHVSPEDLVAAEGAPDYEGWSKNRQERETAMSQRQKMAEEYNSNLEFSKQAVTEFAAENNMDEEQAATFLGKFDEMLAEINAGKISKETLLKIKKMMDYDNDVAQAKETGEIAGKNQKIVAEKQAAPIGDGLPTVTGSDITKEPAPAQTHPIDEILKRSRRTQVT